MITEFVKAWDANKEKMRAWFRRQAQENLSYETILCALITEVINPFVETKWDTSRIHVIDDGDYQGCQLFIVPEDTYQPAPFQYFVTYQYYGSCSGCDLLLGIMQYDNGEPSEEQINDYMLLSLHLLQHCKYFIEFDEE